jgi:GTP cyclohydrolase I
VLVPPARPATGVDMDDRSNDEFAIDLKRIAAAVREILTAMGEDPDREGL